MLLDFIFFLFFVIVLFHSVIILVGSIECDR